MALTVSNLNRINTLQKTVPSDISAVIDDPEKVETLRSSLAEIARLVEVELDRIYESLREVNEQAETAATAAQTAAIAAGLWEISNGRLIPKPL